MSVAPTLGTRAVHDGSLAELAVTTIRLALTRGLTWEPGRDEVPTTWWEPGVTFVTLERDDDLLGCVGALEPSGPLARDVSRHALGAAFGDPRLPSIDAADFEAMSVKVSVLSTMTALDVRAYEELAAVVRPGVDGLVVRDGGHRATFLPSVWPKLASVEEFLALLWRKAGLAPGHWSRDTVVSRYGTSEHASPGPRRLA
jgi:AmmeMemoRadiSam system protein A